MKRHIFLRLGGGRTWAGGTRRRWRMGKRQTRAGNVRANGASADAVRGWATRGSVADVLALAAATEERVDGLHHDEKQRQRGEDENKN